MMRQVLSEHWASKETWQHITEIVKRVNYPPN